MITLTDVNEYVGRKMCRGRQATGQCSCRTKRGHNPCDLAEQIQDNLKVMNCGGALPFKTPPWLTSEIVDWLKRHVCFNAGHCTHKACATGMNAIHFMENYARRHYAA